jgi:hypothetical protein
MYCTKVSLVKPTMKSGSRGVQQNLFCNFCTFLQVSINFRNLHYFLGIKIIKNDLKLPHSAGLKSARGYSASSAPCHARPAERPTGPRPSGPVQPRRRPVGCARVGRAATWSPCVVRAWDGAVAHSPVARWWLAGGKVLG